MSAYPSLLSPLMDATGLIATTALNTLAQTALAAGTYASAEVDVLKISALQESGGNYLGLPDTNITARGTVISQVTRGTAFSSPGFTVSAAGDITSNALSTLVSPGVYGNIVGGAITATTEVVAPIFRNNSDTFITDSLGNCTVNELTYTTLNPPIAPGSVPTIEQVLTAGNDAGNKNITNVNTISATTIRATNSSGTGQGKFNDFEIFSDDGNTRTATFVASGSSAVQNYYLYGVQPTDFAITHDKNILTTGNITCNQLNYTTLNPPIVLPTTPTLSEVLTAGSDANQSSITNLNSITTDILYIPANDHQSNYGILPDLVGLNINAPTLTCSDIVCSGLTTAGQVSSNSLQILSGEDVVASIDPAGVITSTSLIIGDSMGAYAQIASTGALVCGTVNDVSVPFKPTYDYYVSKGGDDNSIYGSILSPYLTIQQAITVCEGEQDGIPRVIHVSAGSYSENLTINKSRISIKGEGVAMHPDVGTSIYGNITINIIAGNSDMHNNNITISGFLINGVIEDSTIENRPHRLTLTNCQLYADDRALYIHPTCDYRAFVNFCYISNDNTTATNPLVECGGSGMITFNNNQLSAKGNSQMVFKLANTARVDVFAQNILTSDSNIDSLAVAIFNHASTQTIALGQNVFIYSSAQSKFNANTASAVYINNNGSLVILSNTVALSGMAATQMAYYNVGTGVIIFGNNLSTSSNAGLTATQISGTLNVSKFATIVSV